MGSVRRFACALVTCLLLPVALLSEERVALVIGNSDYSAAGITVLDNPRNDADSMARALNDLGFKVLSGIDLDREETLALLDDFARTDADVSLVFYAGHGFQIGDQNYLVPVDANLRAADPLSEMIAFDQVVAAARDAGTVSLFFFDACRDNPLSFLPGTASGLRAETLMANNYFIYATSPDKVALDGRGANSPFTEALMGHIRTPGLSLSDMMLKVRGDVLRATGGRQVPWERRSTTSAFYFTPGVYEGEETQLWSLVNSVGGTELAQLYLDRYPNGPHAESLSRVIGDAVPEQSLPGARGLTNASDADRMIDVGLKYRSVEVLEQVIALFPESPRLPDVREALQILRRDAGGDPGLTCERLTKHPLDATPAVPGVTFEELQQPLQNSRAIAACREAEALYPDDPRYGFLHARALHAAGQYDAAREGYLKAAEVTGNARAMTTLARLMRNTSVNEEFRKLRIEQDRGAALALLRRAAQTGDPIASNDLAFALARDMQPDREDPILQEVIELFEAAAAAGLGEAVYNLGVLAFQGLYKEQQEGLVLIERSGRLGYTEGYVSAASLHNDGAVSQRNPDQAAILLLRALEADRQQTFNDLKVNASGWRKDTLASIQTRLKAAGLYDAEANGETGPAFEDALWAWRNGGWDRTVLQ